MLLQQDACCFSQPHAVTSHLRTLWRSRWEARLRDKLACASGCGSTAIITHSHRMPQPVGGGPTTALDRGTSCQPSNLEQQERYADDAAWSDDGLIMMRGHGSGGVVWSPPTPSRLGPAVAGPIIHTHVEGQEKGKEKARGGQGEGKGESEGRAREGHGKGMVQHTSGALRGVDL